MSDKKINWKTLRWLWLLCGITGLFVLHRYLLGNQTVAFYDAGSDTKDQYLMWYSSIVNQLKSGNFSAWDFTNGLGMNAMGHNLTDPFLIPVYILGVLFGTEHLSWYMVYTQVAKIFLAGTFCYFYLSEFKVDERAKLLASYIYAFNGYLMVWGQHYALGTAVVLLPLLLMYIERVLKKRTFSAGLCLISFLIVCCSFYQGYMCMLGGGIYTCMRIWMQEGETIKRKTVLLLTEAGTMLLGVLLAAFRLFPSAAAQVGSSGRVSSDGSLWERIFEGNLIRSAGYYKTILYRMFSSNIQGNGENVFLGKGNYYEASNLFFSTLFIILLFQYLVRIPGQKGSRKSKVLQYISVVIVAVIILVPAASVPFNGFVDDFSRHTFLLMPLFALLCAVSLTEIFREKRLNLPALAATVLFMAAVYWKAYRLFDQLAYQNNAFFLCFSGFVMAASLWAYCSDRMGVQQAGLLLTLALVVNVVSDSSLCYSPRVALTKDHPEYYQETFHSAVDQALSWIDEQEDGFYRVEKDYFSASSCMDSQVQNYRGVSTYNSNASDGIKKMAANLWRMLYNENDSNHMQFQNGIWDSVMGSLCGVRYVLSKSPDLCVVGYELCHQIEDIYIYRNTNSDSIGKFFDKTISEEEYAKKKEKLNTEVFLTDVLIVDQEDEFAVNDSEIEGYEKEKISDILSEGKLKRQYEYNGSENPGPVSLEFQLDPEKLKQYRNLTLEFKLKVSGRTEIQVFFDDCYGHTFVANKITKKCRFSIPTDVSSVKFTVKNLEETMKLSEVEFYGSREETEFSKDAVINIRQTDTDNRLEGEILASGDGMVMLAIPNELGWKVYLDGEEQDVKNGEYGFISFRVEKGEHQLTVAFTAPLLKEGILISLVALAVFLGILFMIRKNKKMIQRER